MLWRASPDRATQARTVARAGDARHNEGKLLDRVTSVANFKKTFDNENAVIPKCLCREPSSVVGSRQRHSGMTAFVRCHGLFWDFESSTTVCSIMAIKESECLNSDSSD